MSTPATPANPVTPVNPVSPATPTNPATASTPANPGSMIDWVMPPGKPDWLLGAGATRVEKVLVFGIAIAGTAVVLLSVALTDASAWQWWQYLVAAILALDLLGGVVANGLGSAKRAHHASIPKPKEFGGRLVRRPILFAVLHVQPIVAGLLFPGAGWWWGVAWYLVTLAGVVAVRNVPLYLQRPIALFWVTGVAIAAPLVASPVGLGWLPVIMALKLVLAHAVREEPYRPTPARDR